MAGPTMPSPDYWDGYQRGIEAGHAVGYAEGLAVLDDAAEALARLKPSRTVEVAEARARLAEQQGPSLSPAEIRIRAAESWGLPAPEGLVDHVEAVTTTELAADQQTADLAAVTVEPAVAACAVAAREPAVAELADDDDWFWAV